MRKLTYAIALVLLGALWGKVQAQAVYKCNWQTYSQQPCSSRVVRSYDAPVEVPKRKSADIVAHRLPGETSQELALRKHRIALRETDRDECARLDKKIPFEHERIRNSPNQDEIDEAEDSAFEAKKRFKQLRC